MVIPLQQTLGKSARKKERSFDTAIAQLWAAQQSSECISVSCREGNTAETVHRQGQGQQAAPEAKGKQQRKRARGSGYHVPEAVA